MRRWVRVQDGRIKRPCWVPEGATVHIDYWMPSANIAPEWVLLVYPVRAHDYLHRDERLQEFMLDALRKLNDAVGRREEAYFLALTAAYRAIGPAWQVRFIPDMAWWTR